MKVAHFIMVHKDPLFAKRLVNSLLTENDHVYIHVDAKFDKRIFVDVISHPNVYFVDQTIDVKWGGYSQVEGTLAGMKLILASGINYDYINFLSGQDYPIKPILHFHKFLDENRGKEFIEYIFEEERPEVTRKRIYKYNFTDYSFKGKYAVQKLINSLTPNRKFPIPDFKIVWKANWFILTPGCVQYVIDFLNENPKVVRFFKFGWGVDEFVFQTIIYNSNYKDKIVNKNYRYVDWSEGNASPKTLGMVDLDSIITSDNFFARKFDMNFDSQILDHLDTILKD